MSAQSTLRFTMPNEDVMIEATFVGREFTLHALSNTQGVTLTGSGRYKYGETVTISASVPEGMTFVGWLDTASQTTVSTDLTYTFPMPSRDMTIYKDVDGTAYLFHSSNHNKTMNVARLTDDYADVDGLYVSVLVDQEREAPALFYHEGMYYMVSSGCTGWAPNAALFAICPNLMGQWKLIDNPCEGKFAKQTFFGQSSYVFEADGKFYLMLDHWKSENLRISGYSILPIEITDDNCLVIPWKDEWNGI